MQPEERDLITGLFGRLNQFEAQPRDPEAERLIGQAVAAQPGAPYLLVQTVLAQEQALKAAQARIAELEAKAVSPGFVASAPKIGPWGNASVPPTQPMQQQQVAPAYAPPAGGGFMRQALMTAAGVAGGALLFEGIRNMMGGHGNAFAAQSSPLMPPADNYQPNQFSSADLAQDDGASDDYDNTDDSSGFDSGGSDDI